MSGGPASLLRIVLVPLGVAVLMTASGGPVLVGTSLSGTIVVKEDEAGSDPYMLRAGSGSSVSLVVELGEEEEDGVRPMTISGAEPWFDVSGWLEPDKSFEAFGRGLVGSVGARVALEFTGTYDPEAGELSGDYAVDVNALLGAGHPTVYHVEARRDDAE